MIVLCLVCYFLPHRFFNAQMEGNKDPPCPFSSQCVNSVCWQTPLAWGLVRGGIHIPCLQYIQTDHAISALLLPNRHLGSLQEQLTHHLLIPSETTDVDAVPRMADLPSLIFLSSCCARRGRRARHSPLFLSS